MSVFGFPEDKVLRNGLPTLCRDWQMLKWRAGWRTKLHPLTDLSSTNVVAHKLILADPVKVVPDREASLLTAKMPTCWRIVTFEHDAQTQIIMIGYDDTRVSSATAVWYSNPLRVVYRSKAERYRDGKSVKDFRDEFAR